MKAKFYVLIVAVLVVGGLWFYFHQSKVDHSAISFLGENSSTLKAMIAVQPTYEKTPGAVKVNYQPNTFDEAFTKSLNDFSKGTGLYDVVVQYNFTLATSVRNNYVYDINELTGQIPAEKKAFEKDIFPSLWHEVGYYYKDAANISKGEKMVSYPYLGISMVLMYNRRLFEDSANQAAYQEKFGKALAPPDNWKDYYNIASFFTNKAKGTYGVCIEGAAGPLLTAEWTNYLYSMGGKFLDKDAGWEGDGQTKVVVNSAAAKQALQYYLSLKPFNSGNFTSVDQGAQMQIMKEGHTAMAIAWTDMLFDLVKTPSGFDQTFGFRTLPGDKSMVSGGAYFINRQSKHAEQAAKLVIDQLQPASQIELAKHGLCSPLKSTYQNALVQQIPYSAALQQSLERGGIRLEAGPDSELITNIVSTYIQKAWNNEISASQALDQAQAEVSAKRKQLFAQIK